MMIISFAETVGWPTAVKEATRSVFAHPSLDILTEVSTVKLVDGLDYTLKQAAGRAIIHRLIDGNDFYSLIPE